MFAIQDEIAGAIAEKLRIELVHRGAEQAPRPGPRNLEAYELFLKGRALQIRRGASLLESRECFERAVELDPDLAEAHALSGRHVPPDLPLRHSTGDGDDAQGPRRGAARPGA